MRRASNLAFAGALATAVAATVAAAHPQHAAPCRSVQLHLGRLYTQGINSLETGYGFAVIDRSSRPCTVHGFPTVTVPPGQPASIAIAPTMHLPTGVAVDPERAVLLEPGKANVGVYFVVSTCPRDVGSQIQEAIVLGMPNGYPPRRSYRITVCRRGGSSIALSPIHHD